MRESISAHHLNLDELIRELYAEQSPGAQAIRDVLMELFGRGVLTADREDVDRVVLKAEVACASSVVRESLHALTAPHVERLFRRAVREKRGLILVEWAQLCETRMDAWVNGNAVVVESPDQREFLTARGAAEFFKVVEAAQWPADRKVKYLREASASHGCGKVWWHVNRRGGGVNSLAQEVGAWVRERCLNVQTRRTTEDEL